jgi:hypothetical protein
MPAENDHSVVNLGAVAPFPADGDSLPFTVGDSNPGKMKNLPPSSASTHEIGQGIYQTWQLHQNPIPSCCLINIFVPPSSVCLQSENLV